jgi:hypothetical protein
MAPIVGARALRILHLVRKRPGKFAAVVFVAAAVVTVAGCKGSSSSSQSANGTSAIGSTSSSSSAGATAPSGVATSPASTAESSNATAPAGTKASAGATTAGKPAASTAAKAPGKPTGYTRAGTYTYDLSGSAKSPIGGSQTISGTESYVVDSPKGSEQHSKTTSQQGSQDMTLQVRSTGLYVVDIHISQQGFDEDFRPTGTALYFPANYHTGSKWSWQAKSTDGKYTIAVSSKVSGNATVTVGGQAQKALILDSTLHISGNGVDIVANQRDWVSPTYALILKEHSVSNGKAFGATFGSNVTRQLRSTTPA